MKTLKIILDTIIIILALIGICSFGTFFITKEPNIILTAISALLFAIVVTDEIVE